MTKVIIVIVIMASETYRKCKLWQVLLMASVAYGKGIMASVIMGKVLWQIKKQVLR